MTDVIGTTSNGFNYTAHYDTAALGSIIWAATFRKDGIYSGMRHGRLFRVVDLSQPDLQRAVMDHIDDCWVKEH